MKFLLLSAAIALSHTVYAAPTPTVELDERGVIEKRASITDAANIGYASTNGGTTGGRGGATTTVSTLAQYSAAVGDDTARVVVVSGTISGSAAVKIGSNKTIVGANSSAKLVGIGNMIKEKKNVIIRNLTFQKVLAENGDAIGVQYSSNIWLDHLDVSSDVDHDKDYYDGLIDITHGVDWITVSNTHFHDHWKASLVGHSDNNGAEDKGHLTVTYANNYWNNIKSRTPSFRFGTGHVYNNYFENNGDGINTRQGAQVLVENNVWVNSKKAIFSTDAGYAVARGNDFGGASNDALVGSISSVPYSYSLIATSSVKSSVVGSAGATLSF